jgi:hypothetical protein
VKVLLPDEAMLNVSELLAADFQPLPQVPLALQELALAVVQEIVAFCPALTTEDEMETVGRFMLALQEGLEPVFCPWQVQVQGLA